MAEMGIYRHHSISFTMKESLCVFFFPAPGIYSSIEMLDFGTLRSQGKAPLNNMSRNAEIGTSLGLRQSTQAVVLFLFEQIDQSS